MRKTEEELLTFMRDMGFVEARVHSRGAIQRRFLNRELCLCVYFYANAVTVRSVAIALGIDPVKARYDDPRVVLSGKTRFSHAYLTLANHLLAGEPLEFTPYLYEE